jgi:hypothetical protein
MVLEKVKKQLTHFVFVVFYLQKRKGKKMTRKEKIAEREEAKNAIEKIIRSARSRHPQKADSDAALVFEFANLIEGIIEAEGKASAAKYVKNWARLWA